jgi:hypothetical protein
MEQILYSEADDNSAGQVIIGILWRPKFDFSVGKSTTLEVILSNHLNQFHTHSTHLFNILVNIIPVQMCLR